MSHISVLKFGSSVLRTPEDLPHVVHEIYRELRHARSVVAVVSAFAGVTDRLFEEAREHDYDADPHVLAAHVAQGERQAAAALSHALESAGIPVVYREPQALGLRAEGEPLDAEPCALDTAALTALLEQPIVVVVPGFFASDAQNRPVLLGRGGSDLTALYLARRLGAYCRLLKDVDGIYERDPAIGNGHPQRFAEIDYDDALRVAGELVQPRALVFAQCQKMQFDVSAVGLERHTRVGSRASRFDEAISRKAPLKVILLGLGTVGGGVYQHLLQRPDLFDVRRVVVRDPQKSRDTAVEPRLLAFCVWEAMAEPADLVIEVMGGIEPTLDVVLAALLHGRTVITANKALVAEKWKQFAHFAAGPAPRLRFSAAVGGAIPVLEALGSLNGSGRITRLRAVINGTCNFVLDAMADGDTLEQALEKAVACGFAEADPTQDVSGADAAYKLQILARSAFGHELSDQESWSEGIAEVDQQDVETALLSGRAVRLVASCERNGDQIKGLVGPRELDRHDFLAGAHAEENRVEFFTDLGRRVQLRGKGAGRWPTALSVMGDVYAHLRAVERRRDT